MFHALLQQGFVLHSRQRASQAQHTWELAFVNIRFLLGEV